MCCASISAVAYAICFVFLSYESFLLGCLITVQYKGSERIPIGVYC